MVHMVRIAKTSPRASGPLGLHSDAGASHCEVRAPRSLSFTHSLNSRSDMSKYTILSRGFTLATAAALLCVASAASAAVDTEADWQAAQVRFRRRLLRELRLRHQERADRRGARRHQQPAGQRGRPRQRHQAERRQVAEDHHARCGQREWRLVGAVLRRPRRLHQVHDLLLPVRHLPAARHARVPLQGRRRPAQARQPRAVRRRRRSWSRTASSSASRRSC